MSDGGMGRREGLTILVGFVTLSAPGPFQVGRKNDYEDSEIGLVRSR